MTSALHFDFSAFLLLLFLPLFVQCQHFDPTYLPPSSIKSNETKKVVKSLSSSFSSFHREESVYTYDETQEKFDLNRSNNFMNIMNQLQILDLIPGKIDLLRSGDDAIDDTAQFQNFWQFSGKFGLNRSEGDIEISEANYNQVLEQILGRFDLNRSDIVSSNVNQFYTSQNGSARNLTKSASKEDIGNGENSLQLVEFGRARIDEDPKSPTLVQYAQSRILNEGELDSSTIKSNSTILQAPSDFRLSVSSGSTLNGTIQFVGESSRSRIITNDTVLSKATIDASDLSSPSQQLRSQDDKQNSMQNIFQQQFGTSRVINDLVLEPTPLAILNLNFTNSLQSEGDDSSIELDLNIPPIRITRFQSPVIVPLLQELNLSSPVSFPSSSLELPFENQNVQQSSISQQFGTSRIDLKPSVTLQLNFTNSTQSDGSDTNVELDLNISPVQVSRNPMYEPNDISFLRTQSPKVLSSTSISLPFPSASSLLMNSTNVVPITRPEPSPVMLQFATSRISDLLPPITIPSPSIVEPHVNGSSMVNSLSNSVIPSGLPRLPLPSTFNASIFDLPSTRTTPLYSKPSPPLVVLPAITIPSPIVNLPPSQSLPSPLYLSGNLILADKIETPSIFLPPLPSKLENSVLKLIRRVGLFSTFISLLDTVNVLNELFPEPKSLFEENTQELKFTLFIPTDEAFMQLFKWMSAMGYKNPSTLLNEWPNLGLLLGFHVLMDQRMTNNDFGNYTVLKMLQGSEIVMFGGKNRREILIHDSCIDKKTRAGHSCETERRWGKCHDSFMLDSSGADWRGGYCQRTCKRCSCSENSDWPCAKINKPNMIVSDNVIVHGIERVLFPMNPDFMKIQMPSVPKMSKQQQVLKPKPFALHPVVRVGTLPKSIESWEKIDEGWNIGRATYYGGGDGYSIHRGSCQQGYLCPNKGTGWDTAAISNVHADYEYSCGTCYEVRCNPIEVYDIWGQKDMRLQNTCRDSDASVIVTVTDECPCIFPKNYYSNMRWCCGDMDHFDLSVWAFEKLADVNKGVIGLWYRKVPCNYKPKKIAKFPYRKSKFPGEKPSNYGVTC